MSMNGSAPVNGRPCGGWEGLVFRTGGPGVNKAAGERRVCEEGKGQACSFRFDESQRRFAAVLSTAQALISTVACDRSLLRGHGHPQPRSKPRPPLWSHLPASTEALRCECAGCGGTQRSWLSFSHGFHESLSKILPPRPPLSRAFLGLSAQHIPIQGPSPCHADP